MGGASLIYTVPSDALAPYVTLFYHFTSDSTLDDLERADHAQLRFRLSGGESHYRFVDGETQDAPRTHFVGATSGAVHTYAQGPVDVFGMGLTPGGWSALVGMDASALLNRVLDAEAVLGADARESLAMLAACDGCDAMVAAIEPVLLRLTRQAVAPGTLGFVDAVDAWLSSAPSPELDDLVARTGLSRRQVERRCNALYGVPPKLLARKYRALRVAVAIAAQDQPVDAFYDQSHMIREVQQFTGTTPGKIRTAPGELARLTITQRTALHGRVKPIISDT
jgi:AraC-like DNA-binding protein